MPVDGLGAHKAGLIVLTSSKAPVFLIAESDFDLVAGFAATLSTGSGQTALKTSRHTGSSEGSTGNISGQRASQGCSLVADM